MTCPFTLNFTPATLAQTVMVGWATVLALVAAPALPATKKLLPMTTIGAINSNRAEYLRDFLCTIFSSHIGPTTSQIPALQGTHRGALLPHARDSGAGLIHFVAFVCCVVARRQLLNLLLRQFDSLAADCLGLPCTNTPLSFVLRRSSPLPAGRTLSRRDPVTSRMASRRPPKVGEWRSRIARPPPEK